MENIPKKSDFLEWEIQISESFGLVITNKDFAPVLPYWLALWASVSAFLRCCATHRYVGLLKKWLTQCTQ